MIGKRFSDKKKVNENPAWTYFEYHRPDASVSSRRTSTKSKQSTGSKSEDIDLFARPLIDTILPQPKSQSVFYARTKSKSKSSSTAKKNTQVKRGKKA